MSWFIQILPSCFTWHVGYVVMKLRTHPFPLVSSAALFVHQTRQAVHKKCPGVYGPLDCIALTAFHWPWPSRSCRAHLIPDFRDHVAVNPRPNPQTTAGSADFQSLGPHCQVQGPEANCICSSDLREGLISTDSVTASTAHLPKHQIITQVSTSVGSSCTRVCAAQLWLGHMPDSSPIPAPD